MRVHAQIMGHQYEEEHQARDWEDDCGQGPLAHELTRIDQRDDADETANREDAQQAQHAQRRELEGIGGCGSAPQHIPFVGCERREWERRKQIVYEPASTVAQRDEPGRQHRIAAVNEAGPKAHHHIDHERGVNEGVERPISMPLRLREDHHKWQEQDGVGHAQRYQDVPQSDHKALLEEDEAASTKVAPRRQKAASQVVRMASHANPDRGLRTACTVQDRN